MSRILPGPGDLWAGPDGCDDDRYDQARIEWEADPDGAAYDFIQYLADGDLDDPDLHHTFDAWLASDDAEIAFDRHFDTLRED